VSGGLGSALPPLRVLQQKSLGIVLCDTTNCAGELRSLLALKGNAAQGLCAWRKQAASKESTEGCEEASGVWTLGSFPAPARQSIPVPALLGWGKRRPPGSSHSLQ